MLAVSNCFFNSKQIRLECFTDQANNLDRSMTELKKGGSTKFHGDFALRVRSTITCFSVLAFSRGAVRRGLGLWFSSK